VTGGRRAPMAGPENATPGDRPRVVWSWAFYDWANSAFTTLVVTFIYSTYFTQAMAPDEVTGTKWWSRAIGTSALLIAVASPILGALADRQGTRKRWLAAMTGVCVAATSALAFVRPGEAWAPMAALGLFVIANVAYELGCVFYNAFLPMIATPARIGRVSGYGWGLGYAGGLVCMVLALVGFVQPETPWFGMTKEAGFNVRATNLLVSAWFLVFSLPILIGVPERRTGAAGIALREVFAGLAGTLRAVRRYREAARFLLARLVYNDGLVTVFAFGGIYAAGTFGMSLSEVIFFGIVLNVASGIGAFFFGFVDDRLGGKRTILMTLVALSAATVMAVLAADKAWLWAGGILLGIFVGPNQSASRSLMGRFVPARRQAEFFGFFAFSGKITSFLGPIVLGQMTSAFGSQRAGMASVLGFFLIGGWLLLSVDEESGIAAALEGTRAA
jgi:UMF1 family MFS transporter